MNYMGNEAHVQRRNARSQPVMSGEEFFLPQVVRAIRRRARLIFAVFSLVFVASLAVVLLQQPKYTATALVMVSPKLDRVVTEEQTLTETRTDSAFVDSEIEVLRSRRLTEQLVTELKLDADPLWNASLKPPGPFDAAIAAMKPHRATASGGSAQGADSRRDVVITQVGQALTVKRRGLSYVIEISAESAKPRQAMLMANRLAELYLRSQVEMRYETAASANIWLSKRLEELKAEVQKKSAAVEEYRAQTGLLTSDGVSLTEQQATDVQTSVLMARADLAEKEARYRQVRQLLQDSGSADTIAGALTSDVIRELRAREADVARRQADMEQRYGDLHPSVQNGRVELENIRSQISAEVGRISTNLRNEVDVARTRLQSLESNLGAVRGQLVGNNEALVRLGELQREASAAQTVYESFLQRFHEVSEQGSLQQTESRLVSNAATPGAPSSPNLMIGGVLALLLAGVAALGALVLVEQFDDGLKGLADIEGRLNVPGIAAFPVVSKKSLRLLSPLHRHPAGYLSEYPMSGFAEAFRVLRTSILYADKVSATEVVAVTSALPGEGKTTVSLCLARIAALSGQRVLLIDCDVRRHSLNDLLNIEPKVGLLEVLTGESRLREVVGRDEASGAHVLPVAARAFVPRDMFGSSAMADLLQEVRGAYDLVILDCPPVLAVAESRTVAKLADVAIVVARSRMTPSRATRSAVEQLETIGANVLGVTLNCVDAKGAGGDSYSDPLYFGYGVSRYYEGGH